MVGYYKPTSDSISSMVIIVITIGVGTPAVFILIGILVTLVRKVRLSRKGYEQINWMVLPVLQFTVFVKIEISNYVVDGCCSFFYFVVVKFQQKLVILCKIFYKTLEWSRDFSFNFLFLIKCYFHMHSCFRFNL